LSPAAPAAAAAAAAAATVYYDFGLEKVIREKFFTDPTWCAARGKGRDTPGDYYTSKEAKRLHKKAGASLDCPYTSVWHLGLDFCQWFKSKAHSTGFLTLRCGDLPHQDRSKLRFTRILAIIPGPSEPKSLDPYLQETLAAFREFSPANGGIKGVKQHLIVDGQLQVEQVDHKILLGAVYGDSPGIKKLARWLSHAAYLGCGYCWIKGTYAAGAVRFTGYLCEVEHKLSEPVLCGAKGTALTHKDHVARAELVDSKEEQPSDVGCHGTSIVIKELDYTSYPNTFPVPVPHAGMLGCCKDFWCFVLRPTSGPSSHQFVISSESRRVMAQRASHLAATCDFGRPYTDILSKRGNWVMEDWLHWTETWSVYITAPHEGRPVLPQVVADMWRHLRSGLLYFSRVTPLPDVAQDGPGARTALFAYARLVEQHFGPAMCKYNLHVLVCRLVGQEAARGKAAFSNEYWVENLIQWAKAIVSRRTTSCPELVLLMEMLGDEALSHIRMKYPDLVRTFEEWFPPGAVVRGSNLDAGGPDGTQLLGSGYQLDSKEHKLLLRGWKARAAQGLGPAGWFPGDLEPVDDETPPVASALLYKHADVRGCETLHSTRYLRATQRKSYFVLVKFREGRPVVEVTYMAKVLFFVMLSAQQRSLLRFAVCELHRVQQQSDAVGILWHTSAFDRPTYASYVVSFEANEMFSKHVAALAPDGSNAWFIPYNNMSGADRAY
jgi:hypothetical protein